MELNGLHGPLPTCRVTAERRLVLGNRNNLKLFTWLVVLVAKDLWDRDSAQIRGSKGTGPPLMAASPSGAKNS